ncbi:MAG: cyanophycinase, partial [Armatimonadota bacterium]
MSGRIIVLPLASENPVKSGPPSVELLTDHGAKNVVLWAKADPTDADRLELSELLKGARGIWMAGGDQRRITARLGPEFITKTLQPLVKQGLNVYGTSAGAMACSATMITGNGNFPGTATMAPGLGLTNWIVDTHFTQRGRLPRLQDALRQSCPSAG